jgi:hypothetical protein
MVNYWLLVVLAVLLPLFFWLRVKSYNKRKNQVNARCPHCGTDQRIPAVENYECKNCNIEVRFFNDDGTVGEGTEFYTCDACGEENIVGILTCTGCGLANTKGIPE